jgi:hypothetical protein
MCNPQFYGELIATSSKVVRRAAPGPEAVREQQD